MGAPAGSGMGLLIVGLGPAAGDATPAAQAPIPDPAECGGGGNGGGNGGGGGQTGRYSRRYGVKSRKVDQTPNGAKVTFVHEKRPLSGDLAVTYGGGGKTATWVLSRDQYRLTMAFSGRTMAGTDDRGRRMTGSWNEKRERWDVDSESSQLFYQVRDDFNVGFAIATDLAPSTRSRSAGTSPAEGERVTSAQAFCFDNQVFASSGPFLSLSSEDACDEAKAKVKDACTEENIGDCEGCCTVGNCFLCGCFTIPVPFFSTEFGCTCNVGGHPYANCP